MPPQRSFGPTLGPQTSTSGRSRPAAAVDTAPLLLRAGHTASWRRACQDQQRAAAPARGGALRVRALDAAMPFDFESRARQRLAEEAKLTVGIVGFGNFGQFLARRLVQAGHTVRRGRYRPATGSRGNTPSRSNALESLRAAS